MRPERHARKAGMGAARAAALPLVALILAYGNADARPPIRAAFFAVYPGAVGSRLDNLPSISGHCGVCHYRFTGGGPRNPYGAAIEAQLPNFPNTDAGKQQAILSVQNLDSDGDGFTQLTEITDLASYTNTPTFPGLTPANVGNVSDVNVNDILNYLVPTTGSDTTPPTVSVLSPNGGEAWTGGQARTVTWTATDNVAVTTVDVFYRDSDTAPWTQVAQNLSNSGTFTWFVPNTPTSAARVRVLARDAAANQGTDESNSLFVILITPGGIVPSTLRDFTMPGTPPFGASNFEQSATCVTCHGGYNTAVEPGYNFRGSMMSQSARDPLFYACVAIAEQDAPSSGDLCIRCHSPFAWLSGRSQPTSGAQITASDRDGVACGHCHRMVDPIYKPGVSPTEDVAVLDLLTPSHTPTVYSSGQFVIDPNLRKRGPFADALQIHPILASPLHQSGDLCGTCHDVSNPAFNHVSGADYAPGPLDQAATSFASDALMPLERTYSEWKNSGFPAGVYSPDFAGNKASGIVSTCQDCHMHDVAGVGCNDPGAQVRQDLPLHDLTGGNSWLPPILSGLYPGETDLAALAAGSARAVAMLQKAASTYLSFQAEGDSFRARVSITNRTGHKLPTGYPEGRRMWLHVVARNAGGQVVFESGAYNASTGVLSQTPHPVVYQAELGISPGLAAALGVTAGPSFHFTLNDSVYKDNRIPPSGFANFAYASFGGKPVDPDLSGPGPRYADGQNWDVSTFALPSTATNVVAELLYQTTSKEYVEFLRDANTTNSAGQTMYDLWANNGRAAPVVMQRDSTALILTGVAESGGAPAAPKLTVLKNPFESSLAMRLDLAGPVPVSMQVFDVHGRRIGGKEFGMLGGGTNRIVWDALDDRGHAVGTGVYWTRVRAGDREWVRRVVRMK